MSRTFRKNVRYFDHYRGEYYGGYGNSRSMKVNLELKDHNELWDWKKHKTPECAVAMFRRVVRVCDGDNWGDGMGGRNKKALHRVDRARYRNALVKSILRDNYDNVFDVKPAFDPWDWD